MKVKHKDLRKMKKQIMFSAIVMAMFGLAGCNNEDNVDTSQQDINSYIDVSKIGNVKDWHLKELPIKLGENIDIPVNQMSLSDLPDWLPYVVARTASKNVPLNVFQGKWKDDDVYVLHSVEMSTYKYYDSDGNRIDTDSFVAVLDEATDWSCVASLVKEDEVFDATTMFGKHIDSDLIGVWMHNVDFSPRTNYLEFRSNGSGRLWAEADSSVLSESRFLYTIVDAKLTGAASNWIIVKMAIEGSKLTRYESFVINDGILYYAEDFSPYFSTSGYKRIIE